MTDIPALACRNDDRTTAAGEITAIEVARVLIKEAKMVGRVPRRVKYPQRRVTRFDEIVRVAEANHFNRRPSRQNFFETTDVIGMTMGDEYARERTTGQRRFEAAQVPLFADAGVDQCGHASLKKIRIVPGRSGPRRRVIGVQQKHRFPQK